MGVYYLIVNVDKKELLSPHDFDSGAKMAEWCYQGQSVVLALKNLLEGRWKGDRVYAVSDYALASYDSRYRAALSEALRGTGAKSLYAYASQHYTALGPKDTDTEDHNIRYIYNHALKVFIDLEHCPRYTDWIAPLPLLIAIGHDAPAGGNFEEPVTQATLKVVGAFHGLSRERSDARKYPAIDPMISWSKYPGVIPQAKSDFCKEIIIHGNEIGAMMKVVGQEGTSLDDYITYLKADMLDAVYLQQNSFDPIDANCSSDRQRYVIAKLIAVLGSDYALQEQDEARSFFQRMRQRFIDWNYTEFMSDEFRKGETEIDLLYQEGQGAISSAASSLLKGGEQE